MSAKILVADDSATIQKVVKITLADEPFEIIEALGENELFATLRSTAIDLVLLDFNLSEQKTGYQLAEEITQKYTSTSVMAMLGTFDSVDDNQLKKNGVKDKIVKPFDSQKFVEKCHALIEVSDEQEEEAVVELDIKEDNSTDDAEDAEQWVMEQPEVEEQEPIPVEDILEQQSQANSNVLEEEAESWQGDVPGVIGSEPDEITSAPAVIENEEEHEFDLDSTSTFRLEEIDEEFAQKTPDEDDLEYPDTIAMYQPGSTESSPNPGPTSELISLEELAPEEDEEEEDDVTDPAISLEPNLELEREVEKEVSPDEFWAVDEKIEEEDLSASEEKESLFSADDVDYNKLVDVLKDKLSPFIENVIKDICTQSVEKISWEVIPDLAENLIKKELKDISKSLES